MYKLIKLSLEETTQYYQYHENVQLLGAATGFMFKPLKLTAHEVLFRYYLFLLTLFTN